ncbi:hypothetical protein QFZ45_002982 [Pseudomonas synxantha]|nr:hypothetical protein [Pseudomonas synxantha]
MERHEGIVSLVLLSLEAPLSLIRLLNAHNE